MTTYKLAAVFLALLPLGCGGANFSASGTNLQTDGADVPADAGPGGSSAGGNAGLGTGGTAGAGSVTSGGVTGVTGGVTGSGGGTTIDADSGAGGQIGAGGSQGTGGNPSGGCKAPYTTELLVAAKTSLPTSFSWQTYAECQATVLLPIGAYSTAGSKCQGTPCTDACTLTWAAPVAAGDGFDIGVTATCAAAAWDGVNYCDARWAATYKTSCTLGVESTTVVHVSVGSPSVLASTVYWTVSGVTVSGSWAASPANDCTYFTPGLATDALNKAVQAAVSLTDLQHSCH